MVKKITSHIWLLLTILVLNSAAVILDEEACAKNCVLCNYAEKEKKVGRTCEVCLDFSPEFIGKDWTESDIYRCSAPSIENCSLNGLGGKCVMCKDGFRVVTDDTGDKCIPLGDDYENCI